MNGTILVMGLVVAAGWTALACRLIALSRGKWFRFLEPSEVAIAGGPTVDAIVPARNEEARVAGTVGALLAQTHGRLTVTVVDDQSTDATLARLEGWDSVRLRVIRGVERPEGWVGKTWAVHQGVIGSQAEWLWFVDADMGLHPRALATAIELADQSDADFVSLMPGVRCETFWQGTIAAAFLQLLGQLYPLDRVNDPTRPEAIAAGGFILVKRSAYDAAGGHEGVRRSIIEDVQLARNVKASGGKLAVRLAPELAWTHMYGGFGEIWRGLRKNAYAGMDYMPHKYMTGAIFALTLAWAPILALGWGLARGDARLVAVGVWGWLAQASATAPVLVFLRLRWPFAFSLPAGISAYVAIASSSVWHHHRGRILWKDRVMASSTVVEPPS